MTRPWVPWLILLLVPMVAHLPQFGFGMVANPFYLAAGLSSPQQIGVLPGLPGWNDLNAGMTTQALGRLAAQQWLHGRIPWWNPDSGVGLPLAAEGQNPALFLPFVLLLNAFDGFLYLQIAMQMIAGLATYALLRQLGTGRRPALAGGVLYQLNGTFAWAAGAASMPIAFLPLLLYGLEVALARARQNRPGGWAWIGVALAYSIYAGFPETAYIDGLLALAWACYRLAVTAAGVRRAFTAKVVAGGGTGLLMAMPMILPFLDLMARSYVGMHNIVQYFGFDSVNYITLLSPYVYGPIDYRFQYELNLAIYVGGYIGLPVVLLGLLSLLPRTADGRRRREYGLRLLLAGWVFVAFARVARIAGVTWLVNLVPFIRESFFFRFAPPSWEMAAILLAALAMDDWQRGDRFGHRWVAVAGGICLAAILAALATGWPIIRTQIQMWPDYPVFPIASLAWTGLATAAAGVLVARRGAARHGTLLCGVLAIYATGLFAFPLLSGPRAPHYDRAAVQFLQARLGLSRFYTLGPFAPNYAAFFGIASINYSYLPTPRQWLDHVRARLLPAADDANFNGVWPAVPAGEETPPEALWHRLPAYAALGVRYVVTPTAFDPFAVIVPPTELQPVVPEPLWPGQSLTGIVPGARVAAGRLARLAVNIGTYSGLSDGTLAAELCTDTACATGSALLAGAANNAPIDIALAPPLPVRDGEALRYRIIHPDGKQPVAIWLWPQPKGTDMGAERTPSLELGFATPEPPPRIYRDAIMDIYEIADPAPYFDAPGCTLIPTDREAVQADCAAPATLVRRELAFPGWRAWVNGTEAAVIGVDDLFQTVKLPQGESETRFAYAPPHIGWALGAFTLGLAGWLARLLRGRTARVP